MTDVLGRLAYRAKDKKNSTKWVYGNIIYIKRDKLMLQNQTWGLSAEAVEIIPETLGQWIGLLDRDKNKIWEGDFIKHPRQRQPYGNSRQKVVDVICLVKWDKGFDHSKERLKLNKDMVKNPSLFNREPGFKAYVADSNAIGANWGYNWSVFHNCEVIGNYIDNPEILQSSAGK